MAERNPRERLPRLGGEPVPAIRRSMPAPKQIRVSATSGAMVSDQFGSEHVSDLSSVSQDYLRVIWTVGEWGPEEVTTTMLAKRLGVTRSTVSESIRKLTDRHFVLHERYGGVTLTEKGRSVAVSMVRRHRLLETFLVREFGYRWDEVHGEADVLEHAISDQFLAQMDAKLGYPTRDPHGDPIPRDDGTVDAMSARVLTDLEVGDSGWIVRVADAVPQILRYFDTLGLTLDQHVVVTGCRPFAGTVEIAVGERRFELGNVAARAMWISDHAQKNVG